MQLPGYRYPLGQMPPEPTKADLLRQADDHADEAASEVEELAMHMAEGACNAVKALNHTSAWLDLLDEAGVEPPHQWTQMEADLMVLRKLLAQWEHTTDRMCERFPAKAQVA